MNGAESYNLIDLAIVCVILLAFIFGTWKGFIRSLTAWDGLALGVVLAGKYYGLVAPYLNKISSLDRHVSMILSMILIFVGVQVVFVAIRYLMDVLLDLTRLTWLDRALGGAMGLAAGFLIVAASVQALLVGVPEWPPVKTSKLVRPVDQITGQALKHAPEQVREQAQALIAKLKGFSETSPQSGQKPGSPAPKPPAASPGPGR
jgi:membrane protein required for colicin V production